MSTRRLKNSNQSKDFVIKNKHMQIKKYEVLFDQELNIFNSCVVTLFFNVQTQHNKENETKNIFILKQLVTLFF